jgi:hypothetical protein
MRAFQIVMETDPMRISTLEGLDAVTLKLEGRFIGPGVSELDRAWRVLAPSLGSRKLSVDLCGVTFMDEAGQKLLAEIHKGTSARFVADRPLTKYFADRARAAVLEQPPFRRKT